MLKTAIILIALASFVAGCTEAGPVTVSEADSCARNGGLWRPAQALCDRAMGGGGGGRRILDAAHIDRHPALKRQGPGLSPPGPSGIQRAVRREIGRAHV